MPTEYLEPKKEQMTYLVLSFYQNPKCILSYLCNKSYSNNHKSRRAQTPTSVDLFNAFTSAERCKNEGIWETRKVLRLFLTLNNGI